MNDVLLLKLLLIAMFAAFTHRAAKPLIIYNLRKRHGGTYESMPAPPKPGDRTFANNWPLSRFLLNFILSGQFVSLRDSTLAVLCIVDILAFAASTVSITILLVTTLPPAFDAMKVVLDHLLTRVGR